MLHEATGEGGPVLWEAGRRLACPASPSACSKLLSTPPSLTSEPTLTLLPSPAPAEYSVVEGGPDAQRCLVVRWKRTFPFSFISSREYVIARRLFRAGDALYGITKVCWAVWRGA